ncbi:MAG: hypothetical protein K5756_01195 [Clostridiales bacterium]|nr:hypothetical protein [Clostridiales bacterium]
MAVFLVSGVSAKLLTKTSRPKSINTVTSVSKGSSVMEIAVEKTTVDATEEPQTEATGETAVQTTAETTAAEPETTQARISGSADLTTAGAAPSAPVTETGTEPLTTDVPTTDIPATDAPTTAAPTTAAPTTEAPTDAPAPVKSISTVKGFHKSLVRESRAVDKSYFNDAVFLGDSRQRDCVIYNGLPSSVNYSYVSLSVSTVRTRKVATYNGQKMSPFDALKKNKNFKKVYLMFGTNECGWPSPEGFIKLYSALIDDIRAMNPKAVIYVQSIPPVTKKVSQNSKNGTTKANIDRLNGYILKMADEKGVNYLDVASVMTNSEGYLPNDAAADGIHPNRKYSQIWFHYLETHTSKK